MEQLTFNLTLTDQEVALIGQALAELPLKISKPLFDKIQNSIYEQSQPKEEFVTTTES